MATTPAGRVAVSRRICWIWRRRLKAQSLMNAPFDPTLMVSEKFAVGQPVSRKEDPTLLRGEGRYSDDPNLPGQLYGVMVRSRMARGELRSIDTDAAREMPGVHMVVTAADLDAASTRTPQPRTASTAMARQRRIHGFPPVAPSPLTASRPVLRLMRETTSRSPPSWASKARPLSSARRNATAAPTVHPYAEGEPASKRSKNCVSARPATRSDLSNGMDISRRPSPVTSNFNRSPT